MDDVVRRVMKYYESAQPAGPVAVDGITGQSFRFETDDRMGAFQVFVTARNYYAFQVVGSKLGNPTDGIPKFLSSIRFRNEPGCVDVLDGPGDQPPANTDPSQSSGPVLPARQVTTKASVIIKPEPRYTKEARQNQISGTVVLRAVFSSSGAVTNIQPVSNLPDGLTEQAIAAARQIRFIPPIKDGRFVSMYIQIEYNFNLY
jgi:TonB family protein